MDLVAIYCPECGEEATDTPPKNWIVPGDVPAYSHLDGTGLCPVMTSQGYRPAEPVEHSVRGA